MKETQRTSACGNFTTREQANWPVAKIPTRDVVPWISQNAGLWKEGWDKVAPPLICKQSRWNVVIAVLKKTIAPPFCTGPALWTVSDSYETKVVNSMFQGTDFIIKNPIAGSFRTHQVRG
jgi:hypothetical protein